MIRNALVAGFRLVAGAKGAVIALYLLSFTAGALVTVPLRASLVEFSGGTLEGERLLSEVSPDFLFEFLHYRSSVPPTLLGMLVVVGILYLVSSLFLSGGAFSVLAGTPDGFWKGASRHFGTFVRIVLWTFPVALCLGIVLAGALGVRRLLLGPDPLQSSAFRGNLAVGALAVCLVGILVLVIDFARASAVRTGDRRARRAVAEGVRNICGHPVASVGFLMACSLLGLLALVLYQQVTSRLPQHLLHGVALSLILQQLLILTRTVLRVTRYGGMLHLSSAYAPQFPSPTPSPATEFPRPDAEEGAPDVVPESDSGGEPPPPTPPEPGAGTPPALD